MKIVGGLEVSEKHVLLVGRFMKKKKKVKTQLDVIKSVRRTLPPSGQTFQTKKDKLHRKRKHKGKIDTEG